MLFVLFFPIMNNHFFVQKTSCHIILISTSQDIKCTYPEMEERQFYFSHYKEIITEYSKVNTNTLITMSMSV